MVKCVLLVDFVKEHKRVPKKKETYKGHSTGQWYVYQKKKVTSTECETYIQLLGCANNDENSRKVIQANLDKLLEERKKQRNVPAVAS